MILKRSNQSYEAMAKGEEAHWEVVERMLFIYAKLNPGQGYVQGMNEIIGPIYYIFASNDEYAGIFLKKSFPVHFLMIEKIIKTL